jgi:Holliday junction DNA helicase RuvA
VIVHVAGTLAEKKPTEVVVDIGGIGYRLAIPASSYDRLPAVGQPVKLLSTYLIRDDARLLFGFATEAERGVFESMIAAAGVGPKTALAALSAMTPAEIRETVVAGDVAMLMRIPGVGRKLAERLIVELRDRLARMQGLEPAGVLGDGPAAQARSDARSGLEALGLGRAEAEKRLRVVLRTHPGSRSAEELIRFALREG